MKAERSITRTNMLCWVTTVLLISSCFTAFFIYQKYLDFNQTKRLLKLTEERFVDEVLRGEVEGALRLIAAIREPEIREMSEQELQRLLKMFQKMAPGVEHGGNIHIIAADGTLLSAPERSLLIGARSSDSANKVISGIPSAVPAGKAYSGEFYAEKDGKRRAGSKIRWHAKACPDIPWVICATRDMHKVDVAASVNINRLKIDIIMETFLILILAAAVTLIAIRIAYVMAKSINSEVRNLITRCELGLKEDAAFSVNSFQFREFGIIAKAIATMTKQIRGLLGELKNAAVQSTIAKQIQGGVLSNVSHDLLSNLNGIMGMAQILRMEHKSESERRHCVEAIMDSGKAIMTLIKNVDYAVILDTEKFQPTLRPLKMKDLHEGVARMVEHAIRERNSELEWVCGRDIPERIVSDQHLLSQILINIIEVGLCKSCKSPLKIELANEGVSNEKVSLLFGIQLNGVGLTQAELDEILEFPYVPREYATVGLSLAICNRLAELLGGKFELKTVNSQDLIATLRFEAALAKAELETSASAVAPAPDAGKKPALSILLVDDDSVNREVASLMLKHYGAEVTKACDGRDALSKIEKHPDFSIVFMDCQMPVMDGYAAAREIRRREAGSGRHMPVIALTGYNTPLDEQHCIEAGMDAFMSKPIIMEDLKTVLEKFSLL
ncbi:MAG: response regulator [Victivallales bacterium]